MRFKEFHQDITLTKLIQNMFDQLFKDMFINKSSQTRQMAVIL